MSVLVPAAALAFATSAFWGALEPGPHAVGLETREVADYSRPFRTEGARRQRHVPLTIWFPAEKGGDGDPVPFGRYVSESERKNLERRLDLSGLRLSTEELRELLATPTSAVEGAPRARGLFPLLIFGTGLRAPAYVNTVLGEYLASYGYVVVALPSIPAREDVTPDYDARSVDTQMRDMELAIQELHDYPHVDIERIGLVTWSFGGAVQALLQMKNPDVVGVVSLDAATGYDYGLELVESSIFYEPERATAAFFHATSSDDSAGRVAKNFEYYESVARGPSFLLRIDGASHVEFTSLGSVVPHVVLEREDSTDARRRYELLCLYVRHFLQLAFRDDADARNFLEVAPTRHGFEGLRLFRKP